MQMLVLISAKAAAVRGIQEQVCLGLFSQLVMATLEAFLDALNLRDITGNHVGLVGKG